MTKQNQSPFKKLETIKADLARMQGTLKQAKANLERDKDSEPAKAFLKRVNIEIADLELRLKTAEIEVSMVKRLAKGCTTASGKRIRV